MEEPPIALIIIATIASFVLVTGGVIYFKRDLFAQLFWMIRSRIVAQVEPEGMEPFAFTLQHVAKGSGPYRVCMKLRLSGRGSYSSTGGHSAHVGMTCSYQVAIGEQVITREVVGYGSSPPRPIDRHIRATFFAKTSSGGSYTKSGTIVLTELERCPAGAQIVVEGTCKLDPATQGGPLSVSLRR